MFHFGVLEVVIEASIKLQLLMSLDKVNPSVFMFWCFQYLYGTFRTWQSAGRHISLGILINLNIDSLLKMTLSFNLKFSSFFFFARRCS